MENLDQLGGFGSTALIASLVEKLGYKKLAAVIASLIIAVVFNVAWAYISGNDWVWGIAVGIMTGFASNVYHDNKK